MLLSRKTAGQYSTPPQGSSEALDRFVDELCACYDFPQEPSSPPLSEHLPTSKPRDGRRLTKGKLGTLLRRRQRSSPPPPEPSLHSAPASPQRPLFGRRPTSLEPSSSSHPSKVSSLIRARSTSTSVSTSPSPSAPLKLFNQQGFKPMDIFRECPYEELPPTVRRKCFSDLERIHIERRNSAPSVETKGQPERMQRRGSEGKGSENEDNGGLQAVYYTSPGIRKQLRLYFSKSKFDEVLEVGFPSSHGPGGRVETLRLTLTPSHARASDSEIYGAEPSISAASVMVGQDAFFSEEEEVVEKEEEEEGEEEVLGELQAAESDEFLWDKLLDEMWSEKKGGGVGC
ncbi:uncharacterized protein VTP21DRAFT_1911 [Calcarisporiella thermophila]|uniref:uncharacterized protein n=1 Tax=Calcarisporiella thermophila TaxID=911321 RepID=UPI00374342B6